VKKKTITLTRKAKEGLDAALDPHELTPDLCHAIERHLTDYRDVVRQRAAYNRERAQSLDTDLIDTARRLQKLVASWSLLDHFEAEARGMNTSEFEDELARRIREWESRRSKPRHASRPVDWDRRILVWRVMVALDAAHVKQSGHKDAALFRVLRYVLTLADRLDQRRPTDGIRTVQEVFGDYRDRHRLRYERDPYWPKYT
jgi:hypothetical protein